MKHKYSFITIAILWGLWAWSSIDLASNEVDRSQIYVKSGTTHGATCIKSRSFVSLKFRVEYQDGKGIVHDSLALPLNILCDDFLLEKFDNKSIKISYYKNRYLGIDVDGFKMRDLEESIEDVNDPSSSINFSLIIVVIATLALLMRIRGLSKREANKAKKSN